MSLLVIRRDGWAMQAMPLIATLVQGMETKQVSELTGGEGHTIIMRWGWTGTMPSALQERKVVNSSRAIKRTSQKGQFAKEISDLGIGPKSYPSEYSWFSDPEDGDMHSKWLSRPNYHERGRGIEVVSRELRRTQTFHLQHERYVRRLIAKEKEYRVYVFCGRVIQIERKTVADPSQIAWGNEGSNFTNIDWSGWPVQAGEKAIRAVALAGLHYGAVDVIEDAEGTAYVLEVNTAPDLYGRDDGRPSYVQRVMARALRWHLNNNWDIQELGEVRSFRDMKHPCCEDPLP